ncbi:unnamed protein product [Bursaphelenchus okinawaensis]|uniref:ShKT domain-containing protein n=1 Tax=Bursaphelenchus okinawaensis TaxID=465554 RepID=A0A811L8V0_9BILA|nr:unnamed protein product [Bursaphelenchus okinawaensis]CAG9119966.1 unnamed protein product [Bursaphelenchus okinawaensis]
MSLRILYLYSLLIPEVVAVLPFPLLDFYVPLNDEVECMDYSTDCDAKKGLCKNEAFKDIMYSKCAKTCQICGEIIKDDDPVFNVNIQENLRPDSDQNWKYPRMDTEQSYSNEGYEEVQSYRGQQGPHRGRSGYRGPSDNYVGPPDTYGGHSDEIQSEELDEQAMKHMILRPPPTAPVKPKMRRVIKNCVDIAPNCFYLKITARRLAVFVVLSQCKQGNHHPATDGSRIRGFNGRPLKPMSVRIGGWIATRSYISALIGATGN